MNVTVRLSLHFHSYRSTNLSILGLKSKTKLCICNHRVVETSFDDFDPWLMGGWGGLESSGTLRLWLRCCFAAWCFAALVLGAHPASADWSTRDGRHPPRTFFNQNYEDDAIIIIIVCLHASAYL